MRHPPLGKCKMIIHNHPIAPRRGNKLLAHGIAMGGIRRIASAL